MLPFFHIKNASINDAKLIRTMALEIWPKAYAHILTAEQLTYMLDLMYTEEALQQQMQQGHRFLIVYDDIEPVGFAAYSEIEPRVYKLHKLYVLPSQQGKGTGKFLIEYIISDIKTNDAATLRLNVNRHNTAKIFYEKLGFEVIASEDVDIGNGFFMNDYVMEKKMV